MVSEIGNEVELLERLGPDHYRRALSTYLTLLREICSQFDAREVTKGDPGFVAFEGSSINALAAASKIVRGLAHHPNNDVSELRVRIGVHQGETIVVPGGFVGLDIHRAARISAVAHPGQVLVSEAVVISINNEVRHTFHLKDLGRHRLKDLSEPQHLYQLVVAGVENDFPPLRSLEAFPTNLPVGLTRFIGRAEDVSKVSELLLTGGLNRHGHPPIALVGPGGIGKTRLALQVAADCVEAFPDGTYFVDLAPLSNYQSVLPAIAQTLGVPRGQAPLQKTLKQFLAKKRLLLVLDNFEHVLRAARQIDDLLTKSPYVQVLTTSRIHLGIAQEIEHLVEPLASPGLNATITAEDFSSFDSVALFVDRARAVKPHFTLSEENAPAVVGICQRLDGIPLAIELAAARIKFFSPAALYERLSEKVGALAGRARDLPSRHQTLREAIDWSYTLLDSPEQRLFSCLSIFTGGCTLDAIETVCSTDSKLNTHKSLRALIDSNLIQQVAESSGESRFQYLQLIHEFASEKLEESGRADSFKEKHAEFYIAKAEQAAPLLHTQRGSKLLHEQKLEYNNLRSAFEWVISQKLAEPLRLTGAAWEFWSLLGYVTEGAAAVNRALKLGFEGHIEERSPRLIAESLAGGCCFAVIQGNFTKTRELAHELLGFSEAHAIARGEAYALITLGTAAFEKEDPVSAKALFTRAKTAAQQASDNYLTTVTIVNLSTLSATAGELRDAATSLAEVVRLARADHSTLPTALLNLTSICLRMGKQNDARSHLLEALDLATETGDPENMYLFECAAAVVGVESPCLAAHLLGRADHLSEKLEVPYQILARERRDATFEKLRHTLGESELQKCLDEGAKMPLDRVVELARAELIVMRVPNA